MFAIVNVIVTVIAGTLLMRQEAGSLAERHATIKYY